MPDFLLEVGLEEVPSRMIAAAQAELLKRTLDLLAREKLIGADPAAHAYSTPRRLAVFVGGVLTRQPDISEDITGPAVKIAFKDGLPTAAAEAFARRSGVAVSELRTLTTPKGDYLAATTTKRGRTAGEVLTADLPKEIAALSWPKSMYWRPGKPERFVRPVLWIACLLGGDVVPVAFAGKTAGRATYGHRTLSDGGPIEIAAPDSYGARLEGGFVLADPEVRRHKIRKALDRVTRTLPHARWREDEALVDDLTHLTEWPDVLLGSFDPAFLSLPDEVLVTVMRGHQKYFAVEDASGTLAPHFLTVTNIALDDENAPIIRQGNERVLRARFNDARFFWEFDQRTPLIDRVKLLENVTFQKDLGSYAAKTERVRAIAGYLAGVVESRGAVIDSEALGQAATLAKTDLTTELVREFTELQGVIGGLYAEYQGFSKKVSDAIKDQYIPASMEDGVPRSIEGALLGIADRADTIAGMFCLGMEPTGSKDPFALRRAANGIIKILAESGIPLTLAPIIHCSVDGSGLKEGTNGALQEKMRAFFYDRIEFYLREARGQAYDVVAAVMAPMRNMANYGDIAEAVARAEAVTAMRGSEDFLAVSAAFKRMKNILAQAKETGALQQALEKGGHSAVHPAQAALWVASERVEEQVKVLTATHAYAAALEHIATLRPYVDAFFEQVLVLDPNQDIRRSRLTILSHIVHTIHGIADLSEIVTAG